VKSISIPYYFVSNNNENNQYLARLIEVYMKNVTIGSKIVEIPAYEMLIALLYRNISNIVEHVLYLYYP
jgi:hypothetical protein